MTGHLSLHTEEAKMVKYPLSLFVLVTSSQNKNKYIYLLIFSTSEWQSRESISNTNTLICMQYNWWLECSILQGEPCIPTWSHQGAPSTRSSFTPSAAMFGWSHMNTRTTVLSPRWMSFTSSDTLNVVSVCSQRCCKENKHKRRQLCIEALHLTCPMSGGFSCWLLWSINTVHILCQGCTEE